MCRAKLRVMTFGVQTVLLHRIESPHAAALCQLPIHVRTATARRDRRECYNVLPVLHVKRWTGGCFQIV